ncbi:hypothetical protein BT63DRAFT_475602 [Microthyrium microscopicum]|uniref:Uncharacterized protein n=1 Tax=Microthyrium microscopicum TaxID=703497 RepID=A0A6A6UML1_9PEZI|nr:hypothetical protein BT63DRAFT_475602 [Microthyrium microscopicum]
MTLADTKLEHFFPSDLAHTSTYPRFRSQQLPTQPIRDLAQSVLNPWNVGWTQSDWDSKWHGTYSRDLWDGPHWQPKPINELWQKVHITVNLNPSLAVPNLRQTYLGKNRANGNLSIVTYPLRPSQHCALLRLPAELLDMIVQCATIELPNHIPRNFSEFKDNGSCQVCHYYDVSTVKSLVLVCHQLWQSASPLLYFTMNLAVGYGSSELSNISLPESKRVQKAIGLCRVLKLSSCSSEENFSKTMVKGGARMTVQMQKLFQSVKCVKIDNTDWSFLQADSVSWALSQMPHLRHLVGCSLTSRDADIYSWWKENLILQSPQQIPVLSLIDLQESIGVARIREVTMPHQQWLTDLNISSDTIIQWHDSSFTWSWLPNLQMCRLGYCDVLTAGARTIGNLFLGAHTHTIVLDCAKMCPLPVPLPSHLVLRDLLTIAQQKPAFRTLRVEDPFKTWDLSELEDEFGKCFHSEYVKRCLQWQQQNASLDTTAPLYLRSFELCENPFNALYRLQKDFEGSKVALEFGLPWLDDEKWVMMRSLAFEKLLKMAYYGIRFEDQHDYESEAEEE